MSSKIITPNFNRDGWIRRRFAASFALAAFVLSMASGCTSASQRGQRAMESGRYNEALDHYERAFEAGEKDPQRYRQAANAALKIGDFSLAERYFEQSLRYGGGEPVARELAELYIATSNYTKAVRVLQSILEITDRPQTVFNNLGAALMYAGSPLNAESYLMVAQQMEPEDPVPYVNLGVLYEKYLHNPRLAYGFYKCFLALSKDSRQRGKVQARVTALEVQYQNDFPERFNVACGVAYQPPSAPSKEEMRREFARQAAEDPDALVIDLSDGDKSGEEGAEGSEAASPDAADPQAEPIVVEHMVKDAPAAPVEPQMTDAQALTLAEKEFNAQNHREAVRILGGLSASALDPHAMGIYGRALMALGEFKKAQGWLASAVDQRPTRDTVNALWAVYEELGDKTRSLALCRRFEGNSRYEKLNTQCAPLLKSDQESQSRTRVHPDGG